MKTSSSSSYNAAMFAVVVLLLWGHEARVSMAVTCNPMELSPCLSAFTSSAPPSKQCCSKLKEQEPCLCQYIKDPNFKKYVTSPNANRVAKTCGVSIPKC